MSQDTLMLYKLMVLYMLNKVDFPLTNSQISEFILDKGYTNYFTLQQALHDLSDTELIHGTYSQQLLLFYEPVR